MMDMNRLAAAAVSEVEREQFRNTKGMVTTPGGSTVESCL